MALMIIEVLSHRGDVRERLRVERLPVLLGSAYDCDLVIDDPYVSPHHARLDVDAHGRLWLMDCDSRNGLRDTHGRQLPDPLALGRAETVLHLGETVIRLRDPKQGLRDALPQPKVLHGRWRRWVDLPVLTLAVMSVPLLDAWWNKTDPGVAMLAMSAMGFLVALALWCGIWSLTARLSVGRARFLRQWRITLYAVLMMYLLDAVLPALDILLGLGSSSVWLREAVWAAFIIVVLASHLQNSTRLSIRWIVGSVFGVTLAAVSVSATLSMDAHPPGWNTTLSPWRYSLRGNRNLDHWLGDVDRIEKTLPQGEQH